MSEIEPLAKIPKQGMFPEWPEHIGTLKRISLQPSRLGDLATITLQCGPTLQKAFTVNPRVIQDIQQSLARAEMFGLKAWLFLKGPIENIEVHGEKMERMRIVYVTDKTPYPLGAPFSIAAE